MAVTERSIGGTAPDYSTINSWEAARQASSSSGDTERGLCRVDTFDEHPIIDGWTDGVIIELVADSGAEHGGIEGTGPIIDPTTSGHCLEITEQDCTVLVDGLEFTGVVSDSDEGCRVNASAQPTFRNCLFYDLRVGNDCDGIYYADTGSITIQVECCYFRNMDRGACHHQYARGPATWNLLNCTIWADTVDSQFSGVQLLTDQNPDSVTFNLYNCLIGGNISNCVYKDAGAGTKVLNMYQCIVDDTTPTTHADVTDNVTESATFQEGTGGSGTRVMFLDLTAAGGYDLHLEDDANNTAIDYGDGADAPSSGLDWEGDARATTGTDNVDAGADEIAASGVTGTSAMTMLMPTMSSDGELTYKGVAAADMLIPTMSSTGKGTYKGAAAADMLLPTMSATGEVGNKTGTSAMTMLMPTMFATGEVGNKTGTSSMDMLLPTMSATGEAGNKTGTSAMDMLVPTMAGAGKLTYKGVAAADMLLPTMSATGEAGNKTATSAMDMLIPTMVGTGKLTYKGTSNAAMLVPTMSATGEVGNKTATSAMDMLLPTMASTGIVGATPTGTSAMDMLLPTMTATGKLTYKAVSAMDMPLPTMTAAGVVAHQATSAMDMLLPTMSAVGTVGVVAVVVTTTGSWSVPVSFLTGDRLRVEIDGPAASEVKISATVELQE